jgi:hypothetical protein
MGFSSFLKGRKNLKDFRRRLNDLDTFVRNPLASDQARTCGVDTSDRIFLGVSAGRFGPPAIVEMCE